MAVLRVGAIAQVAGCEFDPVGDLGPECAELLQGCGPATPCCGDAVCSSGVCFPDPASGTDAGARGDDAGE